MRTEQQQIAVGACVRLKSGSPDLLVIGISEEGIKVQWNDEGTRTDTFPRACLTQQVQQSSKHGL